MKRTMVNGIVDVINRRIAGSQKKDKLPKPNEVKEIVLDGIQKSTSHRTTRQARIQGDILGVHPRLGVYRGVAQGSD